MFLIVRMMLYDNPQGYYYCFRRGSCSSSFQPQHQGFRGIIQSRKFPKLNRRLQYLGRANTSRRRTKRTIRHQRASTVRDPTASYWSELLYCRTWEHLARTPNLVERGAGPYTLYGSPRVHSIRARRRTTHAKASYTYLHHECGILSEQQSYHRGKVASLTSQEIQPRTRMS
jgi:hypothetical protein